MNSCEGYHQYALPALSDLNRVYAKAKPEDILKGGARLFGKDLSLATSLGVEDMVITDMLFQLGVRLDSFVLDTRRLPDETYELIETVKTRYNINLRVIAPEQDELDYFVQQYGQDAFYRSQALRLACCQLRKVKPLERALQGKRAWITGLRKAQSAHRDQTEIFSLDARGRVKIAPLANWSDAHVWSYVQKHQVPYNRLHDQGYPSIGCAPCTRAIAPGEDPRAGRWWWENNQKRECGLHLRPTPIAAQNAKEGQNDQHEEASHVP